MKRLLITGFDPFGGQSINPAWEAVKLLSDTIGNYEVHRRMIPTVFGRAAQTVLREAETVKPDVIVCVGQAGGRSRITPEYAAINLRNARIADNEGNRPEFEKISEDGPDGRFSTIPVREMVKAMAERFPAEVSFTAGTFVCNDTLYTLLQHYADTKVRVGFIHVPFLPEQAVNGEPSMPLEDIVAALTLAVEVLT